MTTNQVNVTCPNCGTEITVSVNKRTENPNFGATVHDKALADLIEKIEESGYLDVNGIVRRWIPSQCLAMVYSKEGFHKSLEARGYNYTWKVLKDELKKQLELYLSGDTEAYADRNRWYNKSIALAMASHFYSNLVAYATTTKRYKYRGNREYIPLKCWLNNGKGVFVDELLEFYKKVYEPIERIKNAKNAKDLWMAVGEFDDCRKHIKYEPGKADAVCIEFYNAYKAAGAYYTIKDLIMFEGCHIQVDKNNLVAPIYATCKFAETEGALAALEVYANQIVSDGVADHGYKMLGLLKDFLFYNNFDLKTTQAKWQKQSEIRRALRTITRNSRN